MTWYVCHHDSGYCRRILTARSGTKCASDTLGIDLSSGAMPKNLPCMDKLCMLTLSISTCTIANHHLAIDPVAILSGTLPDILPALSCGCKDAKVDAAIKCVAGCGGLASEITAQKNNLCKDPKAVVDQMNALIASFTGGQLPRTRSLLDGTDLQIRWKGSQGRTGS